MPLVHSELEAEPDPQTKLVTILRDTHDTLTTSDDQPADLTVLRRDNIHIIGVPFILKSNFHPPDLRLQLAEITDTNNPRIVQVIGDSGTSFDPSCLSVLLILLKTSLTSQTLLEYGFTCRPGDTNWLVGELVRQIPVLATRTIANIVAESIQTITNGNRTWDYSPLIRHFVLLYHRDRPSSFGEDTWLSDGVMKPTLRSESDSDTLICLEGGIQSLEQCLNVLERDVRVIAVAGLRVPGSESRFSAARYLLETAGMVESGLGMESFVTDAQKEKFEALRERLTGLIVDGLDLRSSVVGYMWVDGEMKLLEHDAR